MADPAASLPLRLTYSRSRHFGWQRGRPQRGGYTATVNGSPAFGEETSVEGALDHLCEELRAWIEVLDELAEAHPWHEPGDRGETEISPMVRRLLLEGSLRESLGAAAARLEPVLDAADEP